MGHFGKKFFGKRSLSVQNAHTEYMKCTICGKEISAATAKHCSVCGEDYCLGCAKKAGFCSCWGELTLYH